MSSPLPAAPETIDAKSSIGKLLIGPWAEGEFQRVRQQLFHATQPSSVNCPAEAIELLGSGELAPELILLAEPRPNSYTQREIDALQQAAPLARLVMTAGSWCEGELRTGDPVSGVIRLYWYELPGWLAAGAAQRAAGRRPAWSEPLDGVRAGQAIDVATAPSAPANARVIVDSLDFSVFTTLESAFTPLGWQCEWQPRHRPALHAPLDNDAQHAAIWDGGQFSKSELAELSAFAVRMQPAPVVALLDFPRAEYYKQVRRAGAAAIVAKPYQVALLARALTSLLDT